MTVNRITLIIQEIQKNKQRIKNQRNKIENKIKEILLLGVINELYRSKKRYKKV